MLPCSLVGPRLLPGTLAISGSGGQGWTSVPPRWPKLASLAAPELGQKPWERKRFISHHHDIWGKREASVFLGPELWLCPSHLPQQAYLSIASLSSHTTFPRMRNWGHCSHIPA